MRPVRLVKPILARRHAFSNGEQPSRLGGRRPLRRAAPPQSVAHLHQQRQVHLSRRGGRVAGQPAPVTRSPADCIVGDRLRNSYVDLEDPTYLEFRYIKLIADIVEVETAEPMEVSVDGELRRGRRFRYEIQPGALRVFRPRATVSQEGVGFGTHTGASTPA